jgi:hypothetical protein
MLGELVARKRDRHAPAQPTNRNALTVRDKALFNVAISFLRDGRRLMADLGR